MESTGKKRPFTFQSILTAEVGQMDRIRKNGLKPVDYAGRMVLSP